VKLNIRQRDLETAGHQVLTARTGENDIQQLCCGAFELVLWAIGGPTAAFRDLLRTERSTG
jgi:DNA-binding response OmpR family regulator